MAATASHVTTPSIYNNGDQLYLLSDIITEDVERTLIDFLATDTWSSVGT
jgi:hypothetical protein